MKRTTLLTLAALIGGFAAPTAGAQDTAKKSQDGTVVEKAAKRVQKKQEGEAGKKGAKKGGKKGADAEKGEPKDATKQGERIENPRLRKSTGKAGASGVQEKKVRDGAKADRAQNARDKADSNKGRAADARADHVAKVKHIGDLTRRVRAHKVRLAELARLEAVFQGKGEAAKVTRVQELRSKEQANYETILARYETLLGKEDFASFRKRVRLDEK